MTVCAQYNFTLVTVSISKSVLPYLFLAGKIPTMLYGRLVLLLDKLFQTLAIGYSWSSAPAVYYTFSFGNLSSTQYRLALVHSKSNAFAFKHPLFCGLPYILFIIFINPYKKRLMQLLSATVLLF